jgi:hypothetical protein
MKLAAKYGLPPDHRRDRTLALLACLSLCGGPMTLAAGPPLAGLAAQAVRPPTLEVVATVPASPVKAARWSVRYRLTNSTPRPAPLTGWIEAVAYDVADGARTGAIRGTSVPVANLPRGASREGDLVFATTGSIVNGRVEVTYVDITSGYTAPAPNADGVLADVPPAVKRRLLKSGAAKAVSRAQADFTLTPTEAERLAVVFDFDQDSCYPSPAVFADGVPNPGLDAQAFGMTAGCRDPKQLQDSFTYYRKAAIRRGGVDFAVHMYALYFMKDKSIEVPGDAGHRHDWEYALVWTTNGIVTHASFSHHGKVTTKRKDEIHLESTGGQHVKVVYHKDNLSTGGVTHAMRFATAGEPAENSLRRWITPTIAEWSTMASPQVSNAQLREIFNTRGFGEADCSFNDHNFPQEIAKSPPANYPAADDWRAAAR